jgi:hypothetical protein
METSMIDGWAVFVGASVAGGWLAAVLVAAGQTIRTGCWPFFVPRACALTWETARGARSGWAGAAIILIFTVLTSAGTLAVGGVALLAAQMALDLIVVQ